MNYKPLFLGICIMGCGADGDIPINSDTPLFEGIWRGTYSVSTEGGIDSYEVDLQFKNRGEFVLRHLTVGNVATGTYTENVGEKTLLMSVRNSKITAFQLLANTYEYTYKMLSDDQMELSSNSTRYLLNKQSSVQKETLPFDGQWYCPSENEGFKRLYIESGRFWMTHTEPEGVSYFLEGEVSFEASQSNRSEQVARFENIEVHPMKAIGEVKGFLSFDAQTSKFVLELVSEEKESTKIKSFSTARCQKIDTVEVGRR
jgi:hypothetical protein